MRTRTCINRHCARRFIRRARFCPACGIRQRRRLAGKAGVLVAIAVGTTVAIAGMTSQQPRRRVYVPTPAPVAIYPANLPRDPWPALVVSVRSMEFDQARVETVANFVRANQKHLSHSRRLDAERLEQIIDEFEFDDGRQRALAALQPYLAK